MAVSDGKTTAIEHSEPIVLDGSAGSSSPTQLAPPVEHTKGEGIRYGQEEPATSGKFIF